MKKSLVLILQCLLLLSCSENTDYLKKIQDPELFQAAVQNLSDIIVYDIFSPPVASRVYMYPTMAAYEIMAKAYPSQYYSLAGQLTELEKTPKISEDVNPHLAALLSYNTVGKTFIFSEDKMKAFQDKQAEKIRAMNVPRRVRKASQVYADRISEHILAWAKGDLYNQTRTYSKYTILEEDKFWKPTPPDYMDGIEPHWNKIRPLVLDSANQFQPKAPLSFNLTKGSPFQIQLQEVYEIGIGLTDEQVEIAKFWDCNPYVTHHRGHAMFATKKITPGGHWIGITGIVTRQAKSNFSAVINAFTHVSVALFDAFISCWDEKWDTLVVRPETLINKYYDEKWLPLLQTPPFPEYTSGHSVISRASALVLTKLYGNDFAFEDTTELAYGLPARYYNSFIHASEEAAISRFYGGIHYMMAIDEGVNQGNEIGDYITQNLKTQVEPNQITSSK
jgi:hypothetical protein